MEKYLPIIENIFLKISIEYDQLAVQEQKITALMDFSECPVFLTVIVSVILKVQWQTVKFYSSLTASI